MMQTEGSSPSSSLLIGDYMVTDIDRNMISYFIKEKGDITRWSSWEKRKKDIGSEYPELIAALNNLTIAERTLNAIVEKIANEC